MKNIWMLGAVAVLAAGSVVGYLIWSGPQDSPNVRAGAAGDASRCSASIPADSSASPEAAADARMRELAQPAERINHIDWIVGEDWARSDLPVLRKTIVSDPDEEVQLHAVEKSLELAQKEGAGATSVVVQTSLASTKGNTRARGLKAARENPDAGLVPTLIELVDNRDPYATMALNALAYTANPEGHAKILAVAQDETADRKLRERAIALIAVTKDREAYPLLGELANGQDEVLRTLADEVLKVLNEG
jgi:hypothetical protein